MRYSLLSYVRCPACRGALACHVAREAATSVSPFVAATAARAPAAGQAFAPAPAFAGRTPLTARLTALGGPPAPERNREAEVESGVLICGECARWFPVLETLPELLPDHLRDAARDTALLDTLAAGLPADLRGLLRDVPAHAAADDAGAHYKRAEIGIVSKIADPAEFFGPGYSSPFNPGNTEFTIYLIKLFANVVTLLDLKQSSQGSLVIDTGCGYAWTSEWLSKSGIETIGVDICRAYLEVGVRRMGPSRPHLLVADVENLPVADEVADAVLGFESFHHVPDRPRAMAGFARALKDRGVVVLAEPGAAHEGADVSVDTMTKYGILEKGMEIEDVEEYVAGLPFAPPAQHYVLHASAADLERGIYLLAAWRHAIFHGNVFRMRKDSSVVAPRPPADAARVHAAGDPVPTVGSSIDEMRRAQERLTREWGLESQRTAAELAKLTRDLTIAKGTIADVQSSAFWRARRAWVWLASLVGSDRGDVR